MRLAKIIATVVFCAYASLAQAKPHDQAVFSGNDLYKMCASTYDTDYGYCAGYVSAVANTLLTESVAGYRACNLTMARAQEYVDVYTSYALNFQDQLASEASQTVAAALARAFPCVN